MADKTIGELEPVKIGDLPHAPDIYSDIKIPGELQGGAVYITGEQINNYAKAAAKEEADAAAKSAEAAKSDADRAAEKASEAADVALYPPKVQGGHWWTWDSTKNAYTDSGVDATVSLSVADTVTGEPGEPAKVENIGTETDAKLKFTIPQGQKGDPGEVTRADLDAALAKKQDALTGTQGQVVGFDAGGKAVAAEIGGTNLALDTESEKTSVTKAGGAVMGQYWVLSDYGKRVLNTVGQAFTISLEAKADVDGQEIGLNLRFGDATPNVGSEIKLVTLTTEYKKYSVADVISAEGVGRAWIVNSTALGDVVGNVYARNMKVELGTVATDWSPAPEDLAPMSEVNILLKMQDRIYEGMDLTQKFANEIKESPYNGDPWAWIAARIKAREFDGIHVKDHIPFIANGNTFHAEVAGICTYEGYGDTPVGPHIDFICRELWPVNHPMNLVNYNNGISTQEFPWLASDGYHWLNSLKGSVPNGTTVNPELKEVDYTEDGVWYYLPEELKAVIVEKVIRLNRRYSASGLLSDDTGFDHKRIGKLWAPTEYEVLGTSAWGGINWAVSGSIAQYPIFIGTPNRIRYVNKIRAPWWYLTPTKNNHDWTLCAGDASSHAANANTSLRFPVCFRIA